KANQGAKISITSIREIYMSQNDVSWMSSISKGNRIILTFTLILVVLGIIFAGRFPDYGGHFGFWSVLPPLVAIGLAFWTQEVISALFVGIVLCGVISGTLNIYQEFMLHSLGHDDLVMCLEVY